MIAVDTNVLVRLLLNDEPAQVQQSKQLFAQDEIFISDTVLLESAWVLKHAGGYTQPQIAEGLRRIGGFPSVSIESPKRLALTWKWVHDGLDFADAFHLADLQSFDHFVTFDQKFVKRTKRTQSNCEVIGITKYQES